jgi:hypothetical protein
MLIRSRGLADEMDPTEEQRFTLPLEAARCKAREIICQSSFNGTTSVIQKWRQLPDGQIEFAIRQFRLCQTERLAASHRTSERASD